MTDPRYDLSSIPAIDHHCHNWAKRQEPYSADEYRLFFTEALDRRVGPDVPSSTYYRWTIRELAKRFGVEPREDAVIEARAAVGHEGVRQHLMAEANVSHAIVDFGFTARGSDLFSVADPDAAKRLVAAGDIGNPVHDGGRRVNVALKLDLPQNSAFVGRQRIEEAVVRPDQHPIARNHGRRADFACRLECPTRSAGLAVHGVNHAR